MSIAMGQCETTVNFRLSCVVTMATCLLCSHLPFASGQDDSHVPGKGTKLSKRDVNGAGGLELHCKYHPRNCPGGVSMFKKRGSYLIENLRQLLPSTYDSKPEAVDSLSDNVPKDPSSSSSLSSSYSSSAYSSPLSSDAVDGMGLYSNEDKLNRDLFDLLLSSPYRDSNRRRAW